MDMENERDILLQAIRNFDGIRNRVDRAFKMMKAGELTATQLEGVRRLAKEYYGISLICKHVCKQCKNEHAGITPCSGENGRCHLRFREAMGELAAALECACFGRCREFKSEEKLVKRHVRVKK